MRNDEMYLQLYLIRHGESMGNIETDMPFDKTNPPLTEHGKMQAKAVGERFSGFKPDALISSPLDRAYDTAKEISSNTKTEIEIGQLNGSQLHDALAEMGGTLLVDTLKLIENGEVTPVPQDDELATYAGLISKKDGKIDFGKNPEEIERLIRGFDPWPGAFCQLGEEVIKFWKAIPTNDTTAKENGTVINADKDGIKIACYGKILLVTEIQAPGKKRMAVADYLRGHAIESGTKFE